MDHAFFILGSGRCGSTYLYELLHAHPRIALTFEARIIDFLWFCSELVQRSTDEVGSWEIGERIRMKGLVDPSYVERFAPVFARHVLPMIEEFYRAEFPGREFTHWGDKLPHPSAAAAVRHLVPDVRFVLLVRDPRDVACSWRSYAATSELHERAPELAELSAEAHAIKWANLTAGVIRHVDPLLTLRYEDLIADPRGAVDAVLAHLGLPMVDEVDRALAENATFTPHGTSATPQSSVGRWRDEMTREELEAVERICGELMPEFGYAPETR